MKNALRSASCLLAAGLLLIGLSESCRKQTDALAKSAAVTPGDEMVLTPAGFMPKANVHFIPDGHRLNVESGRLQEIESTSGRVLRDFGPAGSSPSNAWVNPSSPLLGNRAPVTHVPGYGSGWITYADWTNTSSTPISSFVTRWAVPHAPTTNSGQTVFLFNGMQDGLDATSHILQPVLQWGPSAAGGGAYWAVTNWYAGSTNAYYGTLETVTAGTGLEGVMTLTAHSGSNYSYTSVFTGYPSASNLTVTNVPQLYWAAETLEAYGITQYSDYPPDYYVDMNDVSIQEGSSYASPVWTPSAPADSGQHTVVVSNNSPGGIVDLYFHQVPLINGMGSYNWYTSGSGSGTITGRPGSTVMVTISAYGPSTGTHLTNFLMTGATLVGSPMGNNVYVSNSSVTCHFVMPTSGSVSWNGYFQESDSEGSGDIAVNPG